MAGPNSVFAAPPNSFNRIKQRKELFGDQTEKVNPPCSGAKWETAHECFRGNKARKPFLMHFYHTWRVLGKKNKREWTAVLLNVKKKPERFYSSSPEAAF